MLRAKLKSGALKMSCEDPDDPGELAAQSLCLALKPCLVRPARATNIS